MQRAGHDLAESARQVFKLSGSTLSSPQVPTTFTSAACLNKAGIRGFSTVGISADFFL